MTSTLIVAHRLVENVEQVAKPLIDARDPWSWDHQWDHMLRRQHQLALIPPGKLVGNAGFSNLASHTMIAPGHAPGQPNAAIRQEATARAVQFAVVRQSASDSPDRVLRELVFSPPPRQRLGRRLAREPQGIGGCGP